MPSLQPPSRPTSIRIFLADGSPDGIRIVGKSNWTGQAVVAGRSQIAEAFRREELGRPGIYVLLGTGAGGEGRIYIGEADVLADRLRQHASGKDFWTRFIAFTSSDGNLNKAHVRYLEARLIGLARQANQWEVENSVAPGLPPLSEADRADAEGFLAEALLVYPILGVDAFEPASAERPVDDAGDDLILDERGATGRARETSDGFVVLQGSRARATETESIHAYLSEQRRQLLERGVLRRDGEHLVFTQDFRFTSPSTAAGVLVGGAANGRRAWKTAAGVPLSVVQDRRTEIEAVS
jgi:hypothetical protein